MADQCPICTIELSEPCHDLPNDSFYYDCKMCGEYEIARSALPRVEKENEEKKSILSHFIRKNYESNKKAVQLNSNSINMVLKNNSVPTPLEQVDNFILWLGDNLKYAGKTIDEVTPIPFQAIIGAVSGRGVQFILDSLKDDGLIKGEDSEIIGSFGVFDDVTLTLSGWQRYEELKHQSTDSYKAFMAMKFDSKYDLLFQEFKKTVDQTGFELIRVDQSDDNNLIDDQIIVGLRRARFVIADLTEQSHGAYWEAGFAEALGKTVILTCREDDFNNIHFDANHRPIIKWTDETLEETAKLLKNRIRANIPGAKMEDDVGQSR